MSDTPQVSTGIEALDQSIDFLRKGDTVTWQIEDIGDYVYVATRFVSTVARSNQRIVYLRFGDHEEVIDAAALQSRGANVKKYMLDPAVGFETFAVQVHRIISSEEPNSFYIFDCLSELQRYWFSDLMICNSVYEHVEDNTTHTVRYTNVFPENRLFSWMHVGHFRPDQNLLMHSVIYRTQVLRDCGMVLPKHTFYEDNIFVYQPLPYVKSMYYMDLDLYRYFIGRADQSVNESVMIGRVDQQLRVTKHMIDCQDLDALKGQKRLRAYMVHYLSVMMAVSDIFLLLDGSAEAHAKKAELWQYLKDHVTPGVYRAVRVNLGGLTDLRFPGGDKVVLSAYRQLRKIFKFN